MSFGAGQDLVNGERAIESLAGDPAFLVNQLVTDHREVRDGPAEGEEAANRMQERVEGQVVLGVMKASLPNEWGGESVRFELGDYDLFMMATPKPTPNFTANHVWRLRRVKGRQVVYVVGNGRPGRTKR